MRRDRRDEHDELGPRRLLPGGVRTGGGGRGRGCRVSKCQEAAISNDVGSDDEVVSDDEDAGRVETALAEVSDAELLAEIARRMGNEAALSQEERKEPKDHRN